MLEIHVSQKTKQAAVIASFILCGLDSREDAVYVTVFSGGTYRVLPLFRHSLVSLDSGRLEIRRGEGDDVVLYDRGVRIHRISGSDPVLFEAFRIAVRQSRHAAELLGKSWMRHILLN